MTERPQPSGSCTKTFLVTISFLVGVSLPSFATIAYAAPVQCECIRALREIRGIPIFGNAWQIKPNLPLRNAVKGDVVLFDYGGVNKDHGGVIEGFLGGQYINGFLVPQFIQIWECNYDSCICGTRIIHWTDSAIKGVFHIDR